jgi:pyruvate/2-oxoglutarate dehydrogenase complex dihydrolipoamide acyltransferase (E2) component
MQTVPIALPPLGEGILEVRVLTCLKQAGDDVSRDEPLVEVQTDKANFVIESPATGVVGEWSVLAGEIYPVGTLITTILQPAGHTPSAGPGVRALPPVTATVEAHVNWEFLDVATRRLEVTTSELVAWCIFRAMERHRTLRTTLVRGARVLSDEPSLGVAVALLHGALSVAPIDSSDDLLAFASAFRRAVSAARSKHQSLRPCSVILSDMSSFGIRSATPIVVAPSIATVFVGEPFQVPVPSMDSIVWVREAKMILAFNHNVINGMAAARFLREIRRNIEELCVATR